MTPIAYEEFQAAVRTSKRAWHIEMSDTYNVDAEDEPFARFLAGEHDDYSWLAEWLDFIADVTARGTLVQRARLVTVPHSDYTRWGLACAAALTRAGEEIRYLPRERAVGIPFTKEDFWLFDDERVILSVFSDDGRQGGFAAADDREMPAQCQTVRNEVWARATPYSEYITSIN